MGLCGRCRLGAVALQDGADDRLVLPPGFAQPLGEPELGPPERREAAARHKREVLDMRVMRPGIKAAVELRIMRLIPIFDTILGLGAGKCLILFGLSGVSGPNVVPRLGDCVIA